MEIQEINLEKLSAEILKEEGNKFPSALFEQLSNIPRYEASKKGFSVLLNIHKAHLIMLSQEELLPVQDIQAIKKALDNIPYEKFYDSKYDRNHEDMYYTLESWMIKNYGDGCANLHIGRSRNDIDATSQRIKIRNLLLDTLETFHKFHYAIIAFAKEHRDLIMVAHTHTQQAQIGTFGHVFIGFGKVLERCITRLQRAYDTVNYSPMGAAAIETSGFAINREIVGKLLGFNGVVENSYDSIAASDHLTEVACAIKIAALELGRMAANFLLWNTQEFDLIRCAPCYVCTSSIMPQKRNPNTLEFIRNRLTMTVGECDTAMQMFHNVTYEDLVEMARAVSVIDSAGKRLTDVGELFYRIIATMKVAKNVFAKWAKETFAVLTEFSDLLVREESISYRTAHRIAHEVSGYCFDHNITLDKMDVSALEKSFKGIVGRDMKVSRETILQSLDPSGFVRVRKVSGGPAEEPMQAMLESSLRQYEKNVAWVKIQKENIAVSVKTLEEKYSKILVE